MMEKEIFGGEVLKITELFSKKKSVSVGNVYGSTISFFLMSLSKRSSPVLLVTEEKDGLRIERELKFLNIETLNTVRMNHPVDLLHCQVGVVITTEKDFYRKKFIDGVEQFITKVDDEPGLEEIENRILESGYHREFNVSEPLEFAKRGGIIDCYPPDLPLPVRIEFDADRVISIREFDPLTQRSIREIKEIKLIDSRKGASLKTINEILPDHTIIVAKDKSHSERNAIAFMEKPGGDVDLAVSPPRIYFGKIDDLRKDIESSKYDHVIFLPSTTQIERIMNLIGNRRVLSKVKFEKGEIRIGFVDDSEKVIYLTESELFGSITIPRPKPKFKGLFVDDILGMEIGDYVVHRDYGIGRYQGLTRIKFDKVEQECLLIEYGGGDRLYLSVEHINLIERYIGNRTPPPLSKLGGSWLRIKRNAKVKTEQYIIELLDLYAKRSIESGISFKPDLNLEAEVESSFGFELTEDQNKAIDEVFSDMQNPRPMDRLVCGDVGYGKTEVAIRAAVRSVINGHQVAVLCPTTILALQHYRTFMERLSNFPFVVEMLSRLVRPQQVKSILSRLSEQKIDIIIGTHRILNPDITFKKLGLLIVDDEHRFGVKQKEMIKKYRTMIDVLMLTATPLPRTLYMSLTGIRDISLINTPPVGRQDVKTEILEWDDDRIRSIVWDEIDRGGQVFFIHNRIETINNMKDKLLFLLPEIRISIIHGRLPEKEICENIVDFVDGSFDLLLSTSIIEAGIDMPNVNTIIVNQAHIFGLADLHQLRGRVGRSQVKGYAYFIIPEEYKLSEESKKRLSALSVYCNLGSGFRLAIRDMEIRGIGNILGSQQHGVINRIGYSLYMRMLRQTIAKIKGKKIYPEPRLDLGVDAYIPVDYIGDPYERIAIYKRLFSTESCDELTEIKGELNDRFGKYPEIVDNLFTIAAIRSIAQQKGVESIYCKSEKYIIRKGNRPFEIRRNLKDLISFLSKRRM